MLCTERHSTDCFDQLDCLVSRHKRDRFTVHAGDTAFAVKTVERQREGREVFVIEMQRQGNFLLTGGRFVREARC